MFTGLLERVPYANPWRDSFESRFATLCRRKSRIAYFYENLDSSTFRYRVFNMVETLNSGDKFSASYFTRDDLPAMQRVLAAVDTLVLCRVRYSSAINQLLMQAKAARCQVFYDVDDLIFDTDFAPLVIKTLGHENEEKFTETFFADMSRLGLVLKFCDKAVATNEKLAAHISEFAGIEAYVIPNFMNQAQWQLSQQLFNAKCDSGFARDEKIHVGYFSGSPTHNKDFELVADDLLDLLKQEPDMVLRLGGYIATEKFKDYKSRIERLPMTDFLNLQISQAKTEINLIPLQKNDFTDCKSELKFFEAAAVGTISIASPSFVYEKCISDGFDGYLANTGEWKFKIAQAIETVRAGYRDMAMRAFENASKRYTGASNLTRIENVFMGAMPVNR